MKFEYNNGEYVKPKVIVIGDFAGVENIFSCDDLQVYIDFANLNVDKTMKDIDKPDYVERKYYNGVDVDETRDNIYKFMEGENLYQYIGDKNGRGETNVIDNINVTKKQWVIDLKKILKNCTDEKSPTNCFLKNYADKRDAIDYIINLFNPPKADAAEPPIVKKIINAASKFDTKSPTLPQVSGWYKFENREVTKAVEKTDKKGKRIIEYVIETIENTIGRDLTNYSCEYAGYDENVNLNDVVSLLKLDGYKNDFKTDTAFHNFKKTKLHKPCGNANNCEAFLYKENIKCHIITSSLNKYFMIDNSDGNPKSRGLQFYLVDSNRLSITTAQNSEATGSNVNSKTPTILKIDSKTDQDIFSNVKNFSVPEFRQTSNVQIDYPKNDTDFEEYSKQNNNDKLSENIQKWKRNDPTNISFYTVCIVTHNDVIYNIPVKVTMTNSIDTYSTESASEDQKLANKIVKGWNMDASKINEAKKQFQTDLDILYGEINRHAKVKEVAQKYCNLRKKEGIFINNELALLTKAVDACYSLKNSGQPLMPKNIPGVNDFFEGRHIFKVLDKVVYDVDSFKKVVDNSMIMKAIFDTCGSLDIFPKKIIDNQMRAGSNEPEPQNELENYTSFSKMLSVVYFLVFDLSRSAEKDNKIQYIDINPLFDLLTQVEYDMELEEFGMDFNTEKQIYINKITNTKTYIENYFVSNGISTSTTLTTDTTLKSNVDVSSMFKAIEDEMKKVNAANSYPEFHIALLGLIETIDKTNMTTSIGTLHTVSRRMNGIKKLTIHPEQRTALQSEISIAQTKEAIKTSNSNSNIPSQSTLKEYNIQLRQTTNESTISSRQTPKESYSEFRTKPPTPLNDVVTNASNINKNEKGIYRTNFENSLAKQHVSENTPSLRRNATFSNLNANNSNLNFEKYLKK